MTNRRWVLATAFALWASPVGASTISLSLENPGSSFYQQTLNNPCVIGNPSCQEPAGFPYTLIPSWGGAPSNWLTPLDSPIYTIGQIAAIVGTGFMVGIDVNTTTKPGATEYLDYFSMYVWDTATGAFVEAFRYTGSPTQLIVNANGNGYSDGLIKGFDISGYNSGLQAYFRANVNGASDGREQFFLISGTAQPCGPANPCPPLPEPAILLMFGTGLGVFAYVARRRRRRA